jgi:hypothetical protein
MTRKRRIALITLFGGLAAGVAIIGGGEIWERLSLQRLAAARLTTDECEQRTAVSLTIWLAAFDKKQMKWLFDDPRFKELDHQSEDVAFDWLLSRDAACVKISAKARIIVRETLYGEYDDPNEAQWLKDFSPSRLLTTQANGG